MILAASLAPDTCSQTWHLDESTLPIRMDALSPQQRAGILHAIKPRIEYHLDSGDPSDLDPVELATAMKNLHVLILKRSQGTLTFISGWTYLFCGAVGNCMTWVLSQDDKILLEDSGKEITVLKTNHNAEPDILFSVHDSASDTDLERWRFSGSKYVLSWCGTSTMGYAGHYKKHPYTYSHPCQQ